MKGRHSAQFDPTRSAIATVFIKVETANRHRLLHRWLWNKLSLLKLIWFNGFGTVQGIRRYTACHLLTYEALNNMLAYKKSLACQTFEIWWKSYREHQFILNGCLMMRMHKPKRFMAALLSALPQVGSDGTEVLRWSEEDEREAHIAVQAWIKGQQHMRSLSAVDFLHVMACVPRGPHLPERQRSPSPFHTFFQGGSCHHSLFSQWFPFFFCAVGRTGRQDNDGNPFLGWKAKPHHQKKF